MLECARTCEAVLDQPEPQILFVDFAPSSLDFEVQAYIRDADYYQKVASELRFIIAAALRKASITLPFPQQEIHIKSDSRTGQTPSPSPLKP